MERPKFKVGDTIVPVLPGRGVEWGIVTKVDNKNYYLKIMRGAAIIPISSQEVYKLKKK